ncbi:MULTISPECIES: enoyl-CoA hydratase-related protein [unclassified Bradyrhizobium]
MAGRVAVREQGAVLTIVLLQADGTNAAGDGLYLAMTGAIEAAQCNPAIRCIVVIGGFDVLAAGSDPADHHAAGGAATEASSPQTVGRFLQALANNTKPIVAAVEGAATGIGTSLVFSCDLVMAAASATFASPLESHDLVPDGAIGLLIPRRLAHHRALSMLVSGRPMRAERACDAGLIDVTVAPGQAAIEAERIAQQLCRLPAGEISGIHTLPKSSAQDVLRRMAADDDHRSMALEATAARRR